MEGIDITDITDNVYKVVKQNFAKAEISLSDKDKKVFDTSIKNFSEYKVKAMLSRDESEKHNYDYLASLSLVGLDVIFQGIQSVSIQSGLKTAFELLPLLIEKGLVPEKADEE
jgi:hypothetical protein